MEPGDGRDRHAGLHGLLNQPDLFLGSVAPTAVGAADDFNAIDGLGHRRTPRLQPRPSGLRRVSGRKGGRSRLYRQALHPLDEQRAGPYRQRPPIHGLGRSAPSVPAARQYSCWQSWPHVTDQLRPRWPKVGKLMGDSEDDVLTLSMFGVQRRTKLHSTNTLEQLNKEGKRRANVVDIFPSEASIIRPIGAVLLRPMRYGRCSGAI